MTKAEMRAYTKSLLPGEAQATDSFIDALLVQAKDAVVLRRFPFGIPESGPGNLSKYDLLTYRLAARYYSRAGAEGEKAHTENGITRTYASVDDADLLKEVVPYAKVVV